MSVYNYEHCITRSFSLFIAHVSVQVQYHDDGEVIDHQGYDNQQPGPYRGDRGGRGYGARRRYGYRGRRGGYRGGRGRRHHSSEGHEPQQDEASPEAAPEPAEKVV